MGERTTIRPSQYHQRLAEYERQLKTSNYNQVLLAQQNQKYAQLMMQLFNELATKQERWQQKQNQLTHSINMLSKQSKEQTDVISKLSDALESEKIARQSLQQEMSSLDVTANNLQNVVERLLKKLKRLTL